jgi:hypothetical protein
MSFSCYSIGAAIQSGRPAAQHNAGRPTGLGSVGTAQEMPDADAV